jgi:uncharacterized protein YbjT (DUF2867 family)
MKKKILVIGAAGFVGAPVAKQLQADGFNIRALVRNAEKARKLLGDQAELMVGNFEDNAALEKALRGVDGVNISVPWSSELQVTRDVTTILARQRRKNVRISYISGTTILPENQNLGYAMVGQKLKAEETLKKSGVEYTILKPNWFMDALPLFVRDDRATIFGRQRQPYRFLALADFARAVSKAHQTESAANRSFVLDGPQAVLMTEALQQYCDSLYPGVKATSMPIWFGKILAALSRSSAMKDMVQMMAYFEKSPKLSTPNGAEKILDIQAMTLEEWLRLQRN